MTNSLIEIPSSRIAAAEGAGNTVLARTYVGSM